VILLYSVYDQFFGNSKRPSKNLQQVSKILEEVQDMKKTILYENVEFILNLHDPKTNLFKITRSYEISNQSDEPIFNVVNGIITNVDKTFHDLNVRSFDENQNELQIIGINVDTPSRKEFTIKLNKPVFKGEKNQKFSITYKVEEPKNYFENLFLINAKKLTFRLIFPTEINLKPKLYAIHEKNREKKLLDMEPTKKEGILTQVEWVKDDGINEKDLLRLEW